MKRARRRVIVVLAICITVLAVGLAAMAQDIAAKPVAYGIETITPINPEVCPGDVLKYPVVVDIVEIPSVLSVVETWCETGAEGMCSAALSRSYQLPLLEYRHIETIAQRVVPITPFIRPGETYEFWHAAVNGSTTGYRVVGIKIKTDCAEGGQGGN
jgi:hypothetical protein